MHIPYIVDPNSRNGKFTLESGQFFIIEIHQKLPIFSLIIFLVHALQIYKEWLTKGTIYLLIYDACYYDECCYQMILYLKPAFNSRYTFK